MRIHIRVCGILIAILLMSQLSLSPFTYSIAKEKTVMIDNNVYEISVYNGYPTVIIFPHDNPEYKMFILIKGIFGAFEVSSLDLPIRNRTISSENVLNALKQASGKMILDIHMNMGMLENQISKLLHKDYSIQFNKLSWIIKGPFTVSDLNGKNVGKKYLFIIADKKTSVYIDNLTVIVYIFERNTFIKYNDKSILIHRGEVKILLAINDVKWETLKDAINKICELVGIEVKPSLMLTMEITAPVNVTKQDIETEIYAESKEVINKLTLGSEVRIKGNINKLYSGFIGIKNLNCPLDLISIIKFIGIIRYFRASYHNDIPLLMGIYRNKSSINLYILSPYLEGGTIVYDPIFTLANEETLSQLLHDEREMKVPIPPYVPSPYINHQVYQERKTIEESFTDLMNPRIYVPNVRVDILIGIILSILLIIIAALMYKGKFHVEQL